MSYQVLARKWRPQNFKQMVGQEHILRALMNALDSDRLHHAYLFTGTRGVGKTTIARILAKCLNCEVGITSTPCGECNSCKEIAAGNFFDLIEVDAASRTKVEDTRELLENVQYAPTSARFKVYLIDEVHMLTGHSFNALLKTLEEPPSHVKFLFATTDPQKLPATILSRCLQFNLKRMAVDMITTHLEYLLEQETIKFERSSLRLIGRAADGSMRDALSLLDQAIAFSGVGISEASVREMLGTISHEPLIDLLNLVIAGEGATLLQRVEDLSSVTPDFDAATDALISLLHQLAVQQVVPDAINDEDSIRELASKISKEEVQLFYQIALQGRRDLPLSPDPRSGFEMLLLRMMSFRPLREGMKLAIQAEPQAKTPLETLQDSPSTAKKKTKLNTFGDTIEVNDTSRADVAKPATLDATQSSNSKIKATNDFAELEVKKSNYSAPQESVPPWEEIPPELEQAYSEPNTQATTKLKEAKPIAKDMSESVSIEELLLADDNIIAYGLPDHDLIEQNIAEQNTTEQNTAEQNIEKSLAKKNDNESTIENDFIDQVIIKATDKGNSDTSKKISHQSGTQQSWYTVVPQLQLSGRTNELIQHCLLDNHENGIISLLLEKDSEDLLAADSQQEIQAALVKFYGEDIRLDFRVAPANIKTAENKQNETPAQRTDKKILEAQQQAQHSIETDPFVQELQNRFGAQIVPGSVKVKHITN